MECGLRERLQSYMLELIQDGGKLGWLAVLGTFATMMAWTGMVKGLAVMLPTLQQQFNTSTWLLGWMIAIVDGTVDIAGPFVPLLTGNLGTRTVIMVSGFILSASFIISSFVSSLTLMAIIFGLFAGPAIGIANIATRSLLGRCFNKSHTTAYGIGGMGASLALVVFAPLTQFFLGLYGWRATMLLIGAIFSHLAVCGALLKPQAAPTDGDYQSVTVDEDQCAVHDDAAKTSSKSRSSNLTSCCASISHAFRLDLFKSVSYWLIAFVFVMPSMMYASWLIYFVPYIHVYKGYSLHDASNFVVVFGIGKIIGNLTIGPLVEKSGLSSFVWLSVSIVVTSINYCVDPWLMNYWPITVNAFVLGCFNSIFYVLNDVITKETIGVDQLGIALGWIGLKAGIMRLLFLFFPGLIYDTLGSYTLAFILMGSMNALSLVAVLALIWLQRRRTGRHGSQT